MKRKLTTILHCGYTLSHVCEDKSLGRMVYQFQKGVDIWQADDLNKLIDIVYNHLTK